MKLVRLSEVALEAELMSRIQEHAPHHRWDERRFDGSFLVLYESPSST